MRALTIVFLSLFAAGGLAAPASAGYKPKAAAKTSKAYAVKKKAPRVAGYRLSGGYRNGDQYTPYIYESDYGNYPRFDNRSFSERVFDGFRSEP